MCDRFLQDIDEQVVWREVETEITQSGLSGSRASARRHHALIEASKTNPSASSTDPDRNGARDEYGAAVRAGIHRAWVRMYQAGFVGATSYLPDPVVDIPGAPVPALTQGAFGPFTPSKQQNKPLRDPDRGPAPTQLIHDGRLPPPVGGVKLQLWYTQTMLRHMLYMEAEIMGATGDGPPPIGYPWSEEVIRTLTTRLGREEPSDTKARRLQQKMRQLRDRWINDHERRNAAPAPRRNATTEPLPLPAGTSLELLALLLHEEAGLGTPAGALIAMVQKWMTDEVIRGTEAVELQHLALQVAADHLSVPSTDQWWGLQLTGAPHDHGSLARLERQRRTLRQWETNLLSRLPAPPSDNVDWVSLWDYYHEAVASSLSRALTRDEITQAELEQCATDLEGAPSLVTLVTLRAMSLIELAHCWARIHVAGATSPPQTHEMPASTAAVMQPFLRPIFLSGTTATDEQISSFRIRVIERSWNRRHRDIEPPPRPGFAPSPARPSAPPPSQRPPQGRPKP
jgi:hypothetical protein